MAYKQDNDKIQKAYDLAKEQYAAFGIDTEKVMQEMDKISISLHCWQGDDVLGFESDEKGLSGGILATGNYVGRARTPEELRQDLDKAMSLLPGKQKVNLHAIYLDTNGKFVDRDQIEPEHFTKWVDWAKKNDIGLDFNGTFFSHPKSASGFTLSSEDKEVREFWIRHGQKSREIAAYMGKELGKPCVNNIWVPDGSKDAPSSRINNRRILKDSLDQVLEKKYDNSYIRDAVESKVFGIGSESYVVGSHEFYMGYALEKDVLICLDAGHFHPTELIGDKISSLLLYRPELLLHVSRGVRWDSDHVVILNDDLIYTAQELKRCDAYGKVHFALDFFDASINRISAWVTGTRSAQKAILLSLLEPTDLLRQAEVEGKLGNRLALAEEFKSLPFGAVWDMYCVKNGVPAGAAWVDAVNDYEDKVLAKR